MESHGSSQGSKGKRKERTDDGGVAKAAETVQGFGVPAMGGLEPGVL